MKSKYKKGEYIKCLTSLSDRSWYHSNAMKIIKVIDDFEITCRVEVGSFEDGENEISEDLVYQDAECKKLSGHKNRKKKLNKIIKSTPNLYIIEFLNDEENIEVEANKYKLKNDFFIFYSITKKTFTISSKNINIIKLKDD